MEVLEPFLDLLPRRDPVVIAARPLRMRIGAKECEASARDSEILPVSRWLACANVLRPNNFFSAGLPSWWVGAWLALIVPILSYYRRSVHITAAERESGREIPFRKLGAPCPFPFFFRSWSFTNSPKSKSKKYILFCPTTSQTGSCHRGDRCPYAHTVFEYWLHPTR